MDEQGGGMMSIGSAAPSLSAVAVQQAEHTKAALDTLDIDAVLGSEEQEQQQQAVLGGGMAEEKDNESGKDKEEKEDESSPLVYVEELADVTLGQAELGLAKRPASFFDVWSAVEKGTYSLEKLPVPRQPPVRRDRVF